MATFFNSWITYSSDVVYRGMAAPDPAKYYACLVDASVAISRTSSIISVIAGELPIESGYQRKNIVFADGFYDNTDQRYEYPDINVSWSASGASFDFLSLVILADAKAVASRVFDNTSIDPTTNVISINGHGLVNGDKVIFVKDAAATLPTGVAESTEYVISSATTDTLQLTGVDFSTAGTGDFFLKSVDGRLVAWHSEAVSVSVLDGQTQPFTIPSVHFNAGYTTGV